MAEISNARNEKLDVQFPNIEVQGVLDDKAPLAYIINWNGSFLDNLVQTRWSYGVRTLAKNTYSCQIILGQRLKLPRFQCYVDYSIESDDIDRMGIITREAKVLLPTNKYFYEDVVYNAWVAKADYRLADKWNVYVQGMYETANVSGWEGHLREHIGYFAGLEYYISTKMDGSSHSVSIDEEGFHVTGHNYEYKDDGKSSFYELVKSLNIQEDMQNYVVMIGLLKILGVMMRQLINRFHFVQ